MIKIKISNILKAFLLVLAIFTCSPICPGTNSRDFFTFSFSEYHCIKSALWHEARSESEEGIKAVLSVIHNRKNTKNYPSTYCKVILQPGQFSYIRGREVPRVNLKGLQGPDKQKSTLISSLAFEAAVGAFNPSLGPDVLWYTKSGVKNRWTKSFKAATVLGKHTFYKES